MSERKYRQRGYQDQEGPGSGRTRDPKRGEAREGPRGRGLGAPGETVFRCRDCGTAADASSIGLDDACDRCGAALHACVNCRFFDPSARWECCADIREPVRGKAAANRCDQWQPKLVSEHGEKRSSGPDAARAAFDDLFDF